MAHKDFKTLVLEDLRLAVLQVLECDPDYSHNERIIKNALAHIGHSTDSDTLTTQLHWLQDQSLVVLTDAGMLVAKLTARGEDVALGRVTVPGVARKRPE